MYLLRDIIRDGSGIEYMTEYTISYARFLLRSWGFTRKVPMGRHVESKQAEDRVVPQEAGAADRGEDEGRLHGMRAGRGDMRGRCPARKGVYTPKGVRGRLHVHTGSHSKTIVFGLITLDGEIFQR